MTQESFCSNVRPELGLFHCCLPPANEMDMHAEISAEDGNKITFDQG